MLKQKALRCNKNTYTYTEKYTMWKRQRELFRKEKNHDARGKANNIILNLNFIATNTQKNTA